VSFEKRDQSSGYSSARRIGHDDLQCIALLTCGAQRTSQAANGQMYLGCSARRASGRAPDLLQTETLANAQQAPAQ
jgi:hypothetical protein